MKKLFLTILLGSLILSCDDPVFYAISEEERPLDPRIAGPSTNFVTIGDVMYVAARGTIYRYNTDGHTVTINTVDHTCYCYDQSSHSSGNEKISGRWSSFSVGGWNTHLAAASNKLYALAGGKITPVNVSTNPPTPETPITIPGKTIQGIFAVDSDIFIGTSDNEIHYYNGSTTTTKITAPTDKNFSMLVGVAYDGTNYYLCNKDSNGIFSVTSPFGTATLVTDSEGKNFTSIINLKPDNSGDVVAMTRGGQLYKVGTTASATDLPSLDREATGALCVWKGKWDGDLWETDSQSLLLAGRQDIVYSTSTGYTHGYLEAEIGSGTISGGFRGAGSNSLSSMKIDSSDHYTSSIGKHGVRYLHQAPDGILFASLNKGVWAYRSRGGRVTWNAEE